MPIALRGSEKKGSTSSRKKEMGSSMPGRRASLYVHTCICPHFFFRVSARFHLWPCACPAPDGKTGIRSLMKKMTSLSKLFPKNGRFENSGIPNSRKLKKLRGARNGMKGVIKLRYLRNGCTAWKTSMARLTAHFRASNAISKTSPTKSPTNCACKKI